MERFFGLVAPNPFGTGKFTAFGGRFRPKNGHFSYFFKYQFFENRLTEIFQNSFK
jgi:hypothetical protein